MPRPRIHPSFVALLSLALLPPSTAAQSPAAGEVVRVRGAFEVGPLGAAIPLDAWVRGEVDAVGSGTLTLVVDDDSGAARRDIVLAPESELEVRRSRRLMPEGVILGAFVGAVIGYRNAPSPDGHYEDSWLYPAEAEAASAIGRQLGGVLEGALVGAVVGGAIGYLFRTHSWQPVVDTSRDLRIGLRLH